MDDKLKRQIVATAHSWLDGDYDEVTKKQVKWLLDNDMNTLTDSFYKGLEFGTGGMRGKMGVGTNRMNIYTVGMAAQGLANYLIKVFAGQEIRVAIAHDCRHNSRLFSEHIADIFASNGLRVYLFDSLRPTPELSFAIRNLGCRSGVVVTASHNPPIYNGFKAYWDDGAQVTSPHDTNIIKEVDAITSISQIKKGLNGENVTIIGEEFDQIYLDAVKSISLSPEAVLDNTDMPIAYTPLHGSGVVLVPAALREFGFRNVHTVKDQNIVDGDFPTVASPNPEEASAMKMVLDLAANVDAEVAFASDPDADRIGIAVKDGQGGYVLLNGNQTCVLLTYYMLRRRHELGTLDGRQYVVKTIVTTEMMAEVARSFGVDYYDCLTGFKYIAQIIRDNEVKDREYVCGGEESFGFLPCEFVRDKDAVCSIAIAAEAAAWAKTQGHTLYSLLKELYVQYGFYKEGMVYIVKEGREGQSEIARMMDNYRNAPPHSICGSPVVTIRDYLSRECLDKATGLRTPIEIEESNVLQYLTEDGTIISIRPSGTEPKIKYYFGVREPLPGPAMFDEINARLDIKIERIKRELSLE